MANKTAKCQRMLYWCYSSYDHLTRLLIKVIDERPNDVVDVIEDLSHDVKWASFEYKQSSLQDLLKTTTADVLAEQQRLLFYRPEEADQEEELVLALLQIYICLDFGA